MDCDSQFTSTSRTLSIAIASPKMTCPGRPQATNGASKPLALLRRAVNPYLPRRLSGDRASVAVAPLHTFATLI